MIEGRISLGALIAVLAAHKEFSAPLKELFRYYQTLEDTRIRYQEITMFFSRPQRPMGIAQPSKKTACSVARMKNNNNTKEFKR